MEITGRYFPVESKYYEIESKEEAVAESTKKLDKGKKQSFDQKRRERLIVRLVMSINTLDEPGDILVFLPGQEDIERVCNKISKEVKKSAQSPSEGASQTHSKESCASQCRELRVLPCFAALPMDEQNQIFESTERGCRKVIVATNIAESSITVDGIHFVVDSGAVKENMYTCFLVFLV